LIISLKLTSCIVMEIPVVWGLPARIFGIHGLNCGTAYLKDLSIYLKINDAPSYFRRVILIYTII
jgi:hypothetical protein